MNRELALAVDTFRETLTELGVSSRRRGLTKPRELGRRAALLAAADVIWRKQLGRLLTRAEVQELLGVRSRQAVSDLVRRSRVLALRTMSGTYVFPAFQFDVEQRRVYPAVAPTIRALKRGFESEFTMAAWFVAPQDLLEGATPADWLHDHRSQETLVEAARRSAAHLAH